MHGQNQLTLSLSKICSNTLTPPQKASPKTLKSASVKYTDWKPEFPCGAAPMYTTIPTISISPNGGQKSILVTSLKLVTLRSWKLQVWREDGW